MDWTDISAINAITPDWVAENVNHEQARAEWDNPMWNPKPNADTHPHAWTEQLGLWRCDTQGEYSVQCRIPVSEMVAGELDWDYALRLPSTQAYIRWIEKGHLPPPISVVQHINGHLVSTNRRRWLAAREAGLDYLTCWYSPTNPARCARSAWWLPERSEFHTRQWQNNQQHGIDNRLYFDAYAYERMAR